MVSESEKACEIQKRTIVDHKALQNHVNQEAPNQLHKIIQSYYFENVTRSKIKELYDLISKWNTRKLSLECFLVLLTKDFPDPSIRAWAITHLDGASDQQLINVMLQLVHLIKFEPYADSALSLNIKMIDGFNTSLPRFLLRRKLVQQ